MIRSLSKIRDVSVSFSILRLFFLLLIGCLPVLIDPGAVHSVSSLHHLAESEHPYLVVDHGLLIYVWSPIVVISGLILHMTPGLIFSRGLSGIRTLHHWIVCSIAFSIVWITFFTELTEELLGFPLKGRWFSVFTIFISFLCLAITLYRVRSKNNSFLALDAPGNGWKLFLLLIVPYLILILLTPKFYWENFHGDGAQAFESARLLLHQPVPFWDNAAGRISAFPGINSMLFAYPSAWFIRLFGPMEASVRFPFLLYIAGLYCAVVSVAEFQRKKRLFLSEHLLIWLTLAVYVVVMSYLATYNPYAADIALPATQDTLFMILFLGFCDSFLQDHKVRIVLFLLLTLISLPTGIPLILSFLLSILIFCPTPRTRISFSLGLLTALIILGSLARPILLVLGYPSPGFEFEGAALVERILNLEWQDYRRFLFLLLPCGIIPVFSLFLWKSHDSVSRSFILVILLYFFFFYIQKKVALHHFVPVMILPIIVFWRSSIVKDDRTRPFLLTALAAGSLISLFLSFPENLKPDTSARIIGNAIEDRLGGYDVSDPESFRRSYLLQELFPAPWDARVPLQMYGGSSLAWYFYANRPGEKSVNYVIQHASSEPPFEMQLYKEEKGTALYIRSILIWKKHGSMKPQSSSRNSLYSRPRHVMFSR
jgi:hypothetical protein